MRTAVQIFGDWATDLSSSLTRLHELSGIHRWHQHNPDDMVVWCGPEFAWDALDADGRRLQAHLHEEFGRFETQMSWLLRGQAKSTQRVFNEATAKIWLAIKQDEMPWHNRVNTIFNDADAALHALLDLLSVLFRAECDLYLLVPDTNALLWYSDLEAWHFSSLSSICIVITAPVLAELDELKVRASREQLREKAESMIRRIKGYRARGKITEGVPLRRPYSSLRADAIEPTIQDFPGWLDPSVQDDRLLATAYELMRKHPQSAVVLVTRDINLQNKAEYYRMAYIEPPDAPVEDCTA